MNRVNALYYFLIFLLLIILFDYQKNYIYGLAYQNKSVDLNDESIMAEIVYKGIKFPTNMAFLKENDILVSEKNLGVVERIINGKMIDRPLIDLNVASEGERGLLGVAIGNQIKVLNNTVTNIFLYLTESKQRDGEDNNFGAAPLGNRIYRYELSSNGSALINPKLLLDLPAGPKSIHNGGEMLIGPDQNLYFIVGDLGDHQYTVTNDKKGTQPDGRAGILRISQNGNHVNDDFELGKKHPLNKYYAYGIRNGFGLDFDPLTGNLWDSELGPGFGDEINMVEPGFNSGWSQVQGVWERSGSKAGKTIFYPDNLVSFKDIGKYSLPKLTLADETGFTAIKFFNSDKLGSKYTNTLFVGDFHSGNLYNFKLNDERNSLILNFTKNEHKILYNRSDLSQFVFGKGFGGIVDIQVSPEGFLYVLSLYYGGDNCSSQDDVHGKDCVNYSSQTPGTIFKIKLKDIT